MYYIELFEDKNKKWRMRIMAENGNIIMSSEAYSSKSAMEKTFNSLVSSTCKRWRIELDHISTIIP